GAERQHLEVVTRDGAIARAQVQNRCASLGRELRLLPLEVRGAARLSVEQVQERDDIRGGDAIQAIDQHLGEMREQLDERDARIGRVVVRPFRRVGRNEAPRLGEQIGEAPVVQDGNLQWHYASSKTAVTSGVPEY